MASYSENSVDPQLPRVPKDLLDYLNRTFQIRHPELHWSDRMIWIENGKRQVMETLKRLYDSQSQTV